MIKKEKRSKKGKEPSGAGFMLSVKSRSIRYIHKTYRDIHTKQQTDIQAYVQMSVLGVRYRLAFWANKK